VEAPGLSPRLPRAKSGSEISSGWPGKVPRSPAAPHKEKREKKQADRKVPDRPVVVKEERLLKKNNKTVFNN
jgi:hypothetical protein